MRRCSGWIPNGRNSGQQKRGIAIRPSGWRMMVNQLFDGARVLRKANNLLHSIECGAKEQHKMKRFSCFSLPWPLPVPASPPIPSSSLPSFMVCKWAYALFSSATHYKVNRLRFMYTFYKSMAYYKIRLSQNLSAFPSLPFRSFYLRCVWRSKRCVSASKKSGIHRNILIPLLPDVPGDNFRKSYVP